MGSKKGKKFRSDNCIVHKSRKTLWTYIRNILYSGKIILRQWVRQYNVITLDRQLITVYESNIRFRVRSGLFIISDSFNYEARYAKKEEKRKKKICPLSSKRETFDGFSFDRRTRRNIGRNNPPIHHRWSWQLKNNARVSIVRAEPFIIELPEFQLAGLHISDSIQCYPVKCKIGTDQL